MNQLMVFTDFLAKYYPLDTQKPEQINGGHLDLCKKNG